MIVVDGAAQSNGAAMWSAAAAIGSASAALFLVRVAWLQYRTAREKIRLDLFNRRFAVHRPLGELFLVFGPKAHLFESVCDEFLLRAKEAKFLFREDVNAYIEEAFNVVVKCKTLKDVTVETMLPTETAEMESFRNWFRKHSDPKDTAKLFDPYLNFADLKSQT
jgi:hypothetical protein